MAELKICRICLCGGVKMYNYDQYNLKQYYEQILSSKVNYKDELPHYFCYVCATMLYKFHKFKEKCHIGQKTLKEMLWSGPLSISQINKHGKAMKWSIDIITKTNRVRSIKVKSKSMTPQKTDHNETAAHNDIIDDTAESKKNENVNEKIETEIPTKPIEEIKLNIENINVEDIPLPEEDNDETFVEDSLNSESLNKIDLKDEFDVTTDNDDDINRDSDVEFENLKGQNDSSSDEEIKPIKKKKSVKQKRSKKVATPAKDKGKKFLVPEKKWNYLDPQYWLKVTLTEEEISAELREKAQHPRYLKAAYKCTDCFKAFSREDMLVRHNKLKHCESIGQFVCRICKHRYKRKGRLAEHVADHYTKFKCLRCEFSSAHKSAVMHNEFHNGVIRQCKYCGEEFTHSSTYYTHVRIKHPSEHVCTLCGASFVSEAGIHKHKKTMHIDDETVESSEGNMYCQLCDVTFETRAAYEQHFVSSAKHSDDDVYQQKVNRPEISKTRKFTGQVRRLRVMNTCKLCNKNFTTQVALFRHHMTDHKDEPMPFKPRPGTNYYANIHSRKEGFNCTKCRKTFPTKGACLRHRAEEHSVERYQYKDEEKHICEICGALRAPNSLAAHLNTHTRAKTYNCSTCGMQLHTKSSLNRHVLTHTGVKPFGCPLCDKCFTQKCSMQLHYRTYHLKEPYPKRNRRKKTENPQESSELEDIIMKEILKKP